MRPPHVQIAITELFRVSVSDVVLAKVYDGAFHSGIKRAWLLPTWSDCVFFVSTQLHHPVPHQILPDRHHAQLASPP